MHHRWALHGYRLLRISIILRLPRENRQQGRGNEPARTQRVRQRPRFSRRLPLPAIECEKRRAREAMEARVRTNRGPLPLP